MALREARRDDVPRLLQLLAEDQISDQRDDPNGDMTPYLTAFDAIASDPNNATYVWEQDGEIVGCFQLTFLPGLLLKGGWRAQVESVRVDRRYRGRKIGEQMMAEAIKISRAKPDCRMLQLTTNKDRRDAHRFYRRLGFVASHEGMKLKV
jgi:ribosomal protein S18 acetylase RimI-like enzyme